MQDALGNIITVRNPKRIISLVPSQTEYLFALGLDSEVVGISKFCIHPTEWRQKKSIVGGTKKVNLEVVRDLHPDLIIANKEENEELDILELQKDVEVYVSDVNDVPSALKMMEDIALICNKKMAFEKLKSQILKRRSSFKMNKKTRGTAIYLIWNNPLMTVGGDTYISNMLREAGFENLFQEAFRYPELTEEELIQLNPQFILLSSEPFPFKDEHLKVFSELLPKSRVMMVDGEMFSWYGARMEQAYPYFEKLID